MAWQETPVIRAILKAFGLNDGASKQDVEEHLQHAAATFSLPQYVPTVPSGETSFEVRITMAAADSEISRISIPFREPILLVGFGFELTGTSEGVTPPALKEVDARIDFQNETLYATARLETQHSSGPMGYVPLSVLDIRCPRYFMKILERNDAECGIALKGRYATNSTSGFALPVSISTVVIVKRLSAL